MILKVIILSVVGIICVLAFKSWTKFTYYKGMKAGMQIADGIWGGKKIEELSKRYDRYKKRG